MHHDSVKNSSTSNHLHFLNLFFIQFRLCVAEPGYKVTIQQDFFTLGGDGETQIPKCRQKSIEMYKPKFWDDVTR